MTKQILMILGITIQFSFSQYTMLAHPASGIVVNDKGEVLFIHTFRGVAKLNPQGKLSYVHDTKGGHWMCLDRDGSFSRTQPVHFERITGEGERPAIIFAAGGAPIAVCRDGNLYYGSGYPGGSDITPGFLTVTRNSPDRKLTVFSPTLKEALHKLGYGVMGLAAGPDGLLYVADPSGSILKVKMDGTVMPLIEHIVVDECDEHAPPDLKPPIVRGLDVAADGTVFAAATGCRGVLKITPDRSVKTILKSERPWSPTGVALHKGDIYVLEYTDPNGDNPKAWRPRVRKLDRDGKVTTLVTLEPEGQSSSQ